jgi:hypothetical protein
LWREVAVEPPERATTGYRSVPGDTDGGDLRLGGERTVVNFPRRLGQGLKLYVLLLGSAVLIAGVWWLNGALLQNTTEETGWPVMVGVVVVGVVAVWIGRHLFAEPGEERYDDRDEPYDWRS